MMFGAGAVYHGIVFARGQLASHGMRGQLGAGIALATFLTRGAHRSRRDDVPAARGRPSASTASPLPPTSYFGILTSTMDRQFLGVSPYWGVGPGPLRFSAHARAAAASRARHRAGAARPPEPRGCSPDFGYRSLNVDEVELTFAGGFTLDGELFEPAAHERRLVAHGAPIAPTSCERTR